MNLRVFVALALLVGSVFASAPVSGLASKYWEARLYPEEGSTTQSITILVRMVDSEPTGSTPRYVYVFYDGTLLVKALASAYVTSTALYTYKWDIPLAIPQTAENTAYGEHVITVRLEEYDGSYSEEMLEYVINEGAPKDTAINYAKLWASVPESVLAGLKGETGAAGVQGPRGEAGVSPSINYSALMDNFDYDAFWNQMPASLLTSLKGETGATGAAGKDADTTLTYAALTLSIIACAALIIPKIMKKKEEK